MAHEPKSKPRDTMTIEQAYANCASQLIAQRNDRGHWEGRLSSSALSTATTISAFSFYLETDQPNASLRNQLVTLVAGAIDWVIDQQNDDGGWGDTPKSHSNISTSMLVCAALTAAGRSEEFAEAIARAEAYIQSKGGIPGLKARYGIDKTFAVPILANCAMAGRVEWKEVAALPFEAAMVPQKFYNLLQLPVVSYAIPALVAIGQAKFVNDPPWDPFRKMIRKIAVNRSLSVLQRMQPSTGGFLEAAPLTCFVCMGLIHAGQADHPVVSNGIKFLVDSIRHEPSDDAGQNSEEDSAERAGEKDGSAGDNVGQGVSIPIDTNLATWLTTLSVNALTETGKPLGISEAERQQCLDWILACQNKSIHPFTGAAPGGWGWTDYAGAVPDADDTPGAMIALARLKETSDFDDSTKYAIDEAAREGIHWLIKLQNRDRGWPTFCRGWGKLPFDRSGLDITAHVLRALLVWKDTFDGEKLNRSIASGFEFLQRGQRKDGSWLPLWFGNQDVEGEENPFYGTAKVLMAYRDANSLDTGPAKFGLNWLVQNQNPDGGWGGGDSLIPTLQRDPNSDLGVSSVEETALCTEILLDDMTSKGKAAAQRGVDWLVRAVNANEHQTCWPIGFYFAKLWYYEDLYPLIFATSALGRAIRAGNTKNAAHLADQINH